MVRFAIMVAVVLCALVMRRSMGFDGDAATDRVAGLRLRAERGSLPLLERIGIWLGRGLPLPWREKVAPSRFAAMTMVVVVMGLLSVSRAVLLAILCVGLVVAGERRRVAQRRRAQQAEFPELVDLLGVALQSGRTLLHAIEFVCAGQDGELHRRLLTAAKSVDHGTRFVDALHALGQRNDAPELSTLVTTLISAERYGVALPLALHELARDVRELRRRQGEAEARRVPIRMLGPLVVFLLPSFALLTVAPLLASGLSSLRLTP